MPEWFDPETLDTAQKQAYGTRADDLRPSGDYGSYAIANRGAGLAASHVNNHNLVYGAYRVAQYACILGRRAFDRIADLGCGLGITTDALARRYAQAEVIGFEISQDAVEFAQKTFQGPRFLRVAINPATTLPGLFDLILCQEFYPFTRTSDRETHRAYVEHLLRHLRPAGVILIELSERDRDKSILATIDSLGFDAKIRSLPFDRVYRYLPLFWPALIASKILSSLLSRATNKCILIQERQASRR